MGGYRKFIEYVILSVLGTLGVSCYILADTFFIANGLGADGLTALNLAIPAYNFIYGSAVMLGVGGATRFSILRETGSRKARDSVFMHTLGMGSLFALGFVLLGLFGAEGLARLLGADAGMLEMTSTYLRVLLLFSPAFILNNILLCFVRCDGSPGLAMAGMLLGSFANILMDYILIFPMGLGMLGAVLATGISPIISMLAMSPHWLRRKNTFGLCRCPMEGRLCGRLLSLGLPSLIDQLAGAVVMIAFNLLILRLEGNIGVAAYGVVANLAIVITSLFTGVAQGVQPLISEAFGRADRQEAGRQRRYAIVTVLVLALLLYGCTTGFAHPLTALFNESGDSILQEIAVRGLRLYFISNPFLAFNIVLGIWFTSIEHPRPAQVLSLLRGCFLILPMAFGLAYVFGMTGVWLAFPATEAMASLLGLWYMLRERTCKPQETLL